MFDVLKLLYDSKYAKILWFGWGTALYFFYWLPRFSVDLDFSLTQDFSSLELKNIKEGLFEYLQWHLSHKGMQIKIDWTLDHSFRYIVQYGGQKKLKVEIATKMYDNVYEIKNLFGLSVQVMDVRFMFAHKLCALMSRYKQNNVMANRDLFDISFLLKKSIEPNNKIVQLRTNIILWKDLDVVWYFQYILLFLQKNKSTLQKNILFGLGELIDHEQKVYMKNKFLDELIKDIGLYLV